MRRGITIAIIIAAVAITTTWAVSTLAPGGQNRGVDVTGGGGSVPMRSIASKVASSPDCVAGTLLKT